MKSIALSGLVAAALPRAICTVRADATDPKVLIEKINTAFEEFKSTNDAAIAAGKTETADVKTKLEAINATISELQSAYDDQQKKLAAAALQPGDRKITDPEYSNQWSAFVRGGVESERIRASLDKSAALRAVTSRRRNGTARSPTSS
jgi:HK97 family phage major capsid protein